MFTVVKLKKRNVFFIWTWSRRLIIRSCDKNLICFCVYHSQHLIDWLGNLLAFETNMTPSIIFILRRVIKIFYFILLQFSRVKYCIVTGNKWQLSHFLRWRCSVMYRNRVITNDSKFTNDSKSTHRGKIRQPGLLEHN